MFREPQEESNNDDDDVGFKVTGQRRHTGLPSVNLLTLFLGRFRPPKQLTSTNRCIYFHQ